MKKLLTLSLALILVLSLSACGNNSKNNNTTDNGANQQNGTSSVISDQGQQQSTPSNTVTREKALETALDKAGLTEAEVRDLDIELDTERGRTVWEIDFEHKGMEFSYDVDAETGNITAVERERDD